jgi:hypothetical protein
MSSRRFLYRLAQAFSVACVCFISQSVIFSETQSAVFSDQKECGDPILKMKCSYPQMDEYQYLPTCCMAKVEGMKYSNEVRALPQKLASITDKCVNDIGKGTWRYLHHYCAGINRIGRFQRAILSGSGGILNMTNGQRDTLLYALSEFKMIERIYLNEGSPLYEETIKNHAKALHYLGREQEAFSKLSEGIAAHPAKDSLYLYLAQMLLNIGNKEKAKQVLELGYSRTNESPQIADMLSRLK